MSYCINCGVELEEGINKCPLCGVTADSPHFNSLTDEALNDPDEKLYSEYASLTQEQRRKLFWELSGIILISGIIISFVIDFIITQSITWSKYCITVCIALLVNTTLFSFWRNRILLVFIVSMVSSSILLILLDLYSSHEFGWGIKLGIPFVLLFYIVMLVFTVLIKVSKRPGFNILGYFFLAIGLAAIFSEGIISIYLKDTLTLRWSIVVFACMIPISAILSFIHYRLRKGINLRRFFHI